MSQDRVLIFDTTLRDGEQCPGASLETHQKLEIARQLERLGVDVIEAGFPIASPGDFQAVQAVAREMKRAQVCGLARCLKTDIDSVWEAVKAAKRPRIHVFLATSDIHMKHKLRKTREQVLEAAEDAVRYAASLSPDVEFSAEDATRSDPEFLCRVLAAVIKAGAKTLNIPDTVGYTVPMEFSTLIQRIRSSVEGIDKAVISVHCHDDLGLAAANSIAAVHAGARQVECTINGLGERGGNAALEEIVMALRVRKDALGMDTLINAREIYRTSRLVSALTGMAVQRNKAIVGANAFAHESGIHQHGMLADRQTYEIMTPESVGVSESSLILGKHSGRHALVKRLEELGCVLTPGELDVVFERFKALADKKKEVFDEDLISFVDESLGKEEETYVLEHLETSSATGKSPRAKVGLRISGGDAVSAVSEGDGPVDAAYRAIDQITHLKPKLLDYSLQAISSGQDAQGEVTIKIQVDGVTATGRGASTDIIEASVLGYLKAINRFSAILKRDRKNIDGRLI